jgi:hypothetical protein
MVERYYTHRAAIFEFDRNGSSARIPSELSGKTRGHMISKDHRYILVLFGLTRAGECEVVSMTSGDSIKALSSMVEWVPLLTIVPTGRVIGALAARHSTWFVQSAPNKLKGIPSPVNMWTSSVGMNLKGARAWIDRKRNKQIRVGRYSRKVLRLNRIRTSKIFISPLDDSKPWTY